MKEIYNQSAGNLVYLGEPDHTTSSAFQSIGLIVEEIEREFTDPVNLKHAVLPEGYHGSLRHSENGYESALDFPALESFFARAYFW